MIMNLDHTVIGVRDLEAATTSYAALLGLEPSWRGEHPGAGTANTLFRLANSYVELLSPRGEGALGARIAEHLDAAGEGMLAVCFGVDDADAFARALRERGVEAGDPVEGSGAAHESSVERRWRTVMLPEAATRGLGLFAIEHQSPDAALPPAKASGDAVAALRALDHVVVHSRDVDASIDLFGGSLGLRLALDRSFEKRRLRLVFFRVGGVTVEVAGSLDAPVDPTASDRFGGMAYQVEDATAGRRRLAEAGFDVSDVRDGNKPGTRVFTVREGTCGVPVLVIEPSTPFRS